MRVKAPKTVSFPKLAIQLQNSDAEGLENRRIDKVVHP